MRDGGGEGVEHLLTREVNGLHLLISQDREEKTDRGGSRRRKRADTLLIAVVSTGGRDGK